MPITVLLADTTEIIRKAMRRLLVEEPEIKIVGEAENFAQTLKMTEELKPEVVVVDLRMADHAGCPGAAIKSRWAPSAPRILAISVSIDEEAKAVASGFGASAFLDKATLGATLIPAILRLNPAVWKNPQFLKFARLLIFEAGLRFLWS